MLKQATIYRYTCEGLNADDMGEALSKAEFVPCGVTQQKSSGFVPPREEHGVFVEVVDGQYIVKALTEVRKVPAQTLAKRTDELAEEMEKHTGRKPGKKIRKELKEQALLELLPMAFTSTSSALVWICPELGLLVTDATGHKADDIVSMLINRVDGLALSLVMTEMSPAVAMAHWLGTGEAPYQFTVDRECELKSTDEMKSVVKYGRHNLDTDEVREHIKAGKVPTKLALTWRDRVSFVMDDCMRLKKIAFLDVVFESKLANAGHIDKGEAFDADVAIMTGELQQMLPDLFEALGGLQTIGLGEVQ